MDQPAAVRYGPAHEVEVVPGGCWTNWSGATIRRQLGARPAVSQPAPGLRVEARAPMA